MRDNSPAQGWKELGQYRIEMSDCVHRVFRKDGNSFVCIGTIRNLRRETNKSLHERCEELYADLEKMIEDERWLKN